MIKRFFIGFILFVISIIALMISFVWGIIEILIGFLYKSRWKKALGNIGDIFLSLAIVVDRLINVLMQFPANRWWQINGYKFGNHNDTISYALGINERDNTLTPSGKKLCAFLNFLDEDHCKNSIKTKNTMK